MIGIIKGTQAEIQQIRMERESLDFKEAQWLQARGWKSSCNVPGSFWTFEKKLKGDRRTVLAPRSLAVSIELNIPRR